MSCEFSPAVMTDLYEYTMLNASLKDGTANRKCIFNIFARHLPYGRRYGVVAGIGRIAEYLKDFRPKESEIGFLRDNNFISDETAKWLENYHFSGTIRAYREGETYFSQSPIVQVEGTFGECVLLETLFLSVLNYDTSVAAAASRMTSAAAVRRSRPFISGVYQLMNRLVYPSGFAVSSSVTVSISSNAGASESTTRGGILRTMSKVCSPASTGRSMRPDAGFIEVPSTTISCAQYGTRRRGTDSERLRNRIVAAQLKAQPWKRNVGVRVEVQLPRAVLRDVSDRLGPVVERAKHVVGAALVHLHADLLRRRKVARSVRADDVRAPRAVGRDAREKGVVERLFDAVEIFRLSRDLPQFAVEPYPVGNVAQLRHSVDAALRAEKVVEVSHLPHRIQFLAVEMPPERLGRRERTRVAGEPVVRRHALEETLHFVRLGEKHGLAEPRGNRTVGERVVDEIDLGLHAFANVRRPHDVVGELPVLRFRHFDVQLDERAKYGHGRYPLPCAGLVDRDAEAPELCDEMVHHLPRRFEALPVACCAIQLDERPHRVLLTPDVEAAVLL